MNLPKTLLHRYYQVILPVPIVAGGVVGAGASLLAALGIARKASNPLPALRRIHVFSVVRCSGCIPETESRAIGVQKTIRCETLLLANEQHLQTSRTEAELLFKGFEKWEEGKELPPRTTAHMPFLCEKCAKDPINFVYGESCG